MELSWFLRLNTQIKPCHHRLPNMFPQRSGTQPHFRSMIDFVAVIALLCEFQNFGLQKRTTCWILLRCWSQKNSQYMFILAGICQKILHLWFLRKLQVSKNPAPPNFCTVSGPKNCPARSVLLILPKDLVEVQRRGAGGCPRGAGGGVLSGTGVQSHLPALWQAPERWKSYYTITPY